MKEKTRTENWPLDTGRRKLLETLTQNGLGAVMTMVSKDCVWWVVAGTGDGVSLHLWQELRLCHFVHIYHYVTENIFYSFLSLPPASPPTQLEQKFHRCAGGFLFYSLVYPQYTNEKPYQSTR